MPQSKGYEVLRTYVRFAFWLTHKRIVVLGTEHIPDGKPVVFAANHQNALMDPLALSCTNRLQILWLARADIFKSRLARPMLKFMKMIPIYRIRDGKENLSNNEQIFQQVTQVLENRESVALFPEAAHSGRRQMLPHKKAIPRIVLEAEAKNNFLLDLQIVPVGIYYDHYWNFNRSLIVLYGQPIEVDSYKEQYGINPQNAMLALRDEIHDKLLPLTMQIPGDQDYSVYEEMRLVLGCEHAKMNFFSKNPALQRFYSDQDLMVKLEGLEVNRRDLFEQVKTNTADYLAKLKLAGATDKQYSQAVNTPLAWQLVHFLGAILTLPLFVFGFLFNVLPYSVPRIILTRKVKDPAFLSTFVFVAGLVLYPLVYLVESGIIWLGSGSIAVAMACFVAMPLAGKIAFQLLQFYQSSLVGLRLKIFQKRRFRSILKLRTELLQTMTSFRL